MATLKTLLANYCRKTYFSGHDVPIKMGVYRPSVLSWSCVRKQFNYYKNFRDKKPEEIPDDVILLLAGGIVFHRLVQSLKDDNEKPYWSAVEVPCSINVRIAGGEDITILGHADAIRGEGSDKKVYEFKHTRSLPHKPSFEHQLQINFYMGALGIPRGILVYVGYVEGGGLGVREFPLAFSEWHLEHLITRAQVLHILLKEDSPPRCSCRGRIHENEII